MDLEAVMKHKSFTKLAALSGDTSATAGALALTSNTGVDGVRNAADNLFRGDQPNTDNVTAEDTSTIKCTVCGDSAHESSRDDSNTEAADEFVDAPVPRKALRSFYTPVDLQSSCGTTCADSVFQATCASDGGYGCGRVGGTCDDSRSER